MEEIKPIGTDTTGFQILTNAVLDLLNNFPDLNGREIMFEELGETSGIAFSANSGALVISEKRSITDHIRQACQFPIMIVYRVDGTDEYRKLKVQEFFDKIGKWLCKEPVEINGRVQTANYPPLSDNRKITRITRKNSYGLQPEGTVQDWILPVTVEYTKEFDMW